MKIEAIALFLAAVANLMAPADARAEYALLAAHPELPAYLRANRVGMAALGDRAARIKVFNLFKDACEEAKLQNRMIREKAWHEGPDYEGMILARQERMMDC